MLQITMEPAATWFPQTWQFEAALRALAGQVFGDAELAEQLQAATEGGLAYADLRPLEPERFRVLTDATARALSAELGRGRARDEKERRLRYGLSLLHALLASDPRVGPPAGEDELAIRDGVVWRAPAASARLAREHLAAAAGGDPTALDLPAATPTDFADMLEACELTVTRYAPGANLEADADAAFAQLHPPLEELAALLRSDPRAGP